MAGPIMNHANAVKPRYLYPVELYRVPGAGMLGLMADGDLLEPAEHYQPQAVDGEEYMAVICWVKRSEVMRCGE